MEAYLKEFGTTQEQDHPLEFYEGLCYLQLNKFDQAQSIFNEIIRSNVNYQDSSWVHYLDRYYLAISYFEQSNYEQAVSISRK